MNKDNNIRKIVFRCSPNPNRPKLEDVRENCLYDLELRSAVCYTELEAISEKWIDLARSLDKAPMPIPYHIEDDDSMVYHVSEAKTT